MDSLALAYLLIVIGLVLLAAELFIPSGGVLFVLAVCGILAGVAMVFREDTTQGWLTLIGILILIPVLGGLLLHYWPRTPMGKRFFLAGPDEDATVASMPVNIELEHLRGRIGRTVSALRPAGVSDFDGRRVDTISEGMMIEAGTWVRCIDVQAGKVIVRAVAKPDLDRLENADFG